MLLFFVSPAGMEKCDKSSCCTRNETVGAMSRKLYETLWFLHTNKLYGFKRLVSLSKTFFIEP